jgi:hypothetical protein
MDNRILTELYHSIYENEEVLDEGIKDFFFGKSDSEAAKNAARKAREAAKQKILKAKKPSSGSRVDWESHLGTSDKRSFHKVEETYSYLINYLVTEGYVNTAEEAEVVLSVMSESKIQEIISESN